MLWSYTANKLETHNGSGALTRVYAISATPAAEKLLAINALIMLYERFGSDSANISGVSLPSGEVRINQINSVHNSRINSTLQHNTDDIYLFCVYPLI